MSNVNQDPAQRGSRANFFRALTPKRADQIAPGQEFAELAARAVLESPVSRKVVSTAIGLGLGVTVVESVAPGSMRLLVATGASAQNLPSCKNDGMVIRTEAAETAGGLPRIPISEGNKGTIHELGWRSDGPFPYRGGDGNFDRAVLYVRPAGRVWEVNMVKGLSTIHSRGFCGTNAQNVEWARTMHRPALQQSSRGVDGNQPALSQIGLYEIDYEAKQMIEHETGTLSAQDLVVRVDVSFNEGGRRSAVPLTAVPKQ